MLQMKEHDISVHGYQKNMLACCNKSRAVCRTQTWPSIPKRTADLDPVEVVISGVAGGWATKNECLATQSSLAKKVKWLQAERTICFTYHSFESCVEQAQSSWRTRFFQIPPRRRAALALQPSFPIPWGIALSQ